MVGYSFPNLSKELLISQIISKIFTDNVLEDAFKLELIRGIVKLKFKFEYLSIEEFKEKVKLYLSDRLSKVEVKPVDTS
ncbi:MAG TPA: hypothetical protein EYP03_02170 [Aquificae bacterium]|nr:hypothetical protein [Aquificota bacterium]